MKITNLIIPATPEIRNLIPFLDIDCHYFRRVLCIWGLNYVNNYPTPVNLLSQLQFKNDVRMYLTTKTYNSMKEMLEDSNFVN